MKLKLKKNYHLFVRSFQKFSSIIFFLFLHCIESPFSLLLVHSTVLYHIILYCIIQSCTALYCIVLYHIILYYTVLYCIVLYSLVLHCIIQSCTALYCIVLYCIVLYCIVLYCIVLYCIVLYCIVLYRIVLYCIILYYIVLYCIILYFIVLYYMIFYYLIRLIFYTPNNLFLISICKSLFWIYNNIIEHNRTSDIIATCIHQAEIRIFSCKKYLAIFQLISIYDNLYQIITSNLCKTGN